MTLIIKTNLDPNLSQGLLFADQLFSFLDAQLGLESVWRESDLFLKNP